jgi:hypothetical protein
MCASRIFAQRDLVEAACRPGVEAEAVEDVRQLAADHLDSRLAGVARFSLDEHLDPCLQRVGDSQQCSLSGARSAVAPDLQAPVDGRDAASMSADPLTGAQACA